MEDAKGSVSLLELKRLLSIIADNSPRIYFRYRLLGEMWQLNFMRILKVTENGLVLLDEAANKVILLSDLLHIIQFELDGRIHNFEPHYHYNLEPEDSSYLYTSLS